MEKPPERRAYLRSELRVPVASAEELAALEQASLQAGLRWLATARRVTPLEEPFVRRLHAQLFGQVWRHAGRYRLGEYPGAPPPAGIPGAVGALGEQARAWRAAGPREPLDFAARFHHAMLRLRAFERGCGIHARVLTDLALRTEFAHPPVPWGGLQPVAGAARRGAYEAALGDADVGDFEPLVRFMTGAEVRQTGVQLALF